MSNRFHSLLSKQNIVLADGSMSTVLYSHGISFNQCFEEVNLSSPKLVQKIHQEYKDAGSQIITTNSFGSNRFRLKKVNLLHKIQPINSQASQLAREIAQDDICVAASIGPLGLDPLPQDQSALHAFSEQASYLLQDHLIDCFILETFYSLNEILLAIQAVQSVSNLPIIAQMSNSSHKPSPNLPAAFSKLASLNLAVLGINCSFGPRDVLESIQNIPKLNIPTIAQPNAGPPKFIEGRYVYLANPEYLAYFTKKFAKMGVKIIGGCCGITPNHIKMMNTHLRPFSKPIISKSIIPPKPSPNPQKITPKTPTITSSLISKKLANSEFISVVELLPPKGHDPQNVLSKSNTLKKYNVHAINIPDGPRASSRMSSLILAQIVEQQTGLETITHYTCRDKNILAIQADILGAHALGIRNILAVTGDPPKLGEYPDSTPVFDLNSISLTHLISSFNQGFDIIQKPIGQPTSFFIGVGLEPSSPNLQNEISRLHQKIQAGAHFIITQPVFDPDSFIKFFQQIKLNIPNFHTPIIAGIWPLVSYKNALFLHREVPGISVPQWVLDTMKNANSKDAALQNGILISQKILKQIKPFVQGVQISAPFGNIQYALQVLKAL